MPVNLFELHTTFTLHRRRYCECCDFPSLPVPTVEDPRQIDLDHPNWDLLGTPLWESGACSCVLCEWESRPLDRQGDPLSVPQDDPNDGVTLEQARANFARFGSMYDPNDLPEWKVTAPSPDVHDARHALRDAYEVLLAAKPDAQKEAWNAVTEAERIVHAALEAQQAADEEQVAEEWDESEEPES